MWLGLKLTTLVLRGDTTRCCETEYVFDANDRLIDHILRGIRKPDTSIKEEG
jgi:hypothetical protein